MNTDAGEYKRQEQLAQPAPPSDAPPDKPPAAPPDGDNGSIMVWQAKVKALEEQLIENAKKFAAELAGVKLKLMEAEMGGGSDSDEDSD